MLRKLAVFGVILFCMASTVLATNYGKVRGSVIDAGTKDPLIGANVVIEGTDLGAATDATGEYFILQVPPGRYTISANVIGYAQMRISDVIVERDHTSRIDFGLRTAAIEGEVVTVIADRDVIKLDLAASQVNATREEITHMPFSTDLESYLDLQPGVEGWEIRGGGADQVGFAVDGLNMVDNAFNQPINMVNMSFIEEVSVIKGGFNAEYGNIRSGMIDVTTEEGSQEFHGSFSYRYSPPHLKHTGYKVTDPRSWSHRPFLDPAVRENGTSGVPLDEEEIYAFGTNYNSFFERFEGWAADTNFSDWEQAMLAYVWEHCIDGYEDWGIPDAADLRREAGLTGRAVDPMAYGHLPDLDMEFSLSGPVPVIGRYLGDMTFILSVRDNKESYVFPTIRDYYHVRNINAKVTSYLGVATKLNLEYLRQDEESVIDEWSGLVGPDNWYEANIYAATPGVADQTGFGIGIDHTVNNRTFWQLRISGVSAKIFTDGPDVFRLSADTVTYKDSIITYFENYGVSQAPYGFSRFPYRVSSIGSGQVVSGVGGAARNDSRISTWSARFDYTSQINRANEIKAGLFFNIDDFDANWRWEEFDVTGNESLNFKANPFRGAAYIQDKIEFQGMVANIGLRMEFTNPNLEWYKLDVDSLRYSKYFSAAYKTQFEEQMPKEKVKGKLMLSPRIGISHPLSPTSKIYFNYGHDYSMPPTMDMYYVNYSRPGSPIWEIGNPNLDLPRTIRYELGFDQELFGQFLVSLVAYYRDVSDEVASVQYVNTTESVDYSMTQNNHYADIRGFEFTLEKRWGRFWTGFINYTFLSTKDGEHGREVQFEDPVLQRLYGFRNPVQEKPLPQPYLNANLRFMTPESFGPVLGAWSVSTNFYWARGEYMTWEPVGRIKRAQNNVRWRDEINFDMRIDKRIDVGGMGLRFYADVFNVFNIQRLTGEGFRDETDEKNYFNSLHLDEYNKEKYEGNPRYKGGDDQPGDYWTKEKDYIDMPNIDLERFTTPRSFTMGIEFEF